MEKDVELEDLGPSSEETVTEWMKGLPSVEDLPPLSQSLISPLLASAFSVKPERCRSMEDVDRAAQKTITDLRRKWGSISLPAGSVRNHNGSLVPEEHDDGGIDCADQGGKDVLDQIEDSINRAENMDSETLLLSENSNDEIVSESMLKRPRLVWTPQLHKRFIDVVGHLGTKNAVPKTIVQLMNVEGLTRENVASHLQKYRLYLKRMEGYPQDEGGPSASVLDPLFASSTGTTLESTTTTGCMPLTMAYVMPTPAAFASIPVNAGATSHSHVGSMAGVMPAPAATSNPGAMNG